MTALTGTEELECRSVVLEVAWRLLLGAPDTVVFSLSKIAGALHNFLKH